MTLAAYITELGSPERIRVGELPVPALGPTDVLVHTQALVVNHVDTYVRSGAYATPTPFPFVIGRDLVGTVTDAGTGVAQLTVGDQVWANSLGHAGRQGSFARDVVVAADRLYRLPPGADPVNAVAVLHTAGTAYLGLLREAGTRPGDTVVVGGGAGGVGSAAVQLAAAAGATVIATASARDAEWCRASGADVVLDYREPNLAGALGAAAPGGVDVFWDTSGHQDLVAIAPLLSVGARVVVTAAANPTPAWPAQHFYTHDISVQAFAISNATVDGLRAAAQVINARLVDGTLKARIGARLPLTEAAEAHRLQESHEVSGRIVVLP